MTRRRRGFSLLELLVVMSLLGAAMMMITVSLHGLYRAEAGLRGDLDREHALEQFLTRWRWDAHTSTTVQSGNDAAGPSGLTLSLADGRTVIYAATSQGMERIVSSNGEILQRETFLLAGRPTANWKVEERPEAGSIVTLHLELPSRRGSASQAFDFQSALGILRGAPPLSPSEA